MENFPEINAENENENQNEQNNQRNMENDAIVGPIELNILERVEYGLAASNQENESETKQDNSVYDEKKFIGQREVIFVSGWANIASIYNQHKNAFIFKILIGFSVIFSLNYNDQKLWPVSLLLTLINFWGVLQGIYSLYIYWHSPSSVKVSFWVDIQESLCYQIYFTGFTFYLAGFINQNYLPLFAVPFFVFSLFVFLYISEQHNEILIKKFMIFDAMQLFFISAKISGMVNSTWNYTLFLYMASAIYLTVLGVFMTLILSCSMIGIFQRRVEAWKVKSLVWLTWNYLSTGFVYIYINKSVIHFYNDDGLTGKEVVSQFVSFKNDEGVEQMIKSVSFLILISAVSLITMLFMKKEVTKFFTKIVYRNEVRKEVSLRFFSKSFTFKLIQASTTYFLKPKKDELNLKLENEENDDNRGNGDAVVDETGNSGMIVKMVGEGVVEREVCVFCCERMPNVMIDGCGHGGVCKECMLNYLKGNGDKCPFCKKTILKIYVLEFDEKDGKYTSKGEIKLRS